jgi:hydroxypyruvate reductase
VALDLPPGVAFLAGASDGVDGASGTAGAVVDASLGDRASRDALARALTAFDTGPLVVAAGMALAPGPTGQNFADVHVLARSARRG